MVEFVLAPPVWMVSISVIAALIWFWYVERRREKLPIEKLDKLQDDFWEFSAKVERKLALLESANRKTEASLREAVEEIGSDIAVAAAANVKERLLQDSEAQANELQKEVLQRAGELTKDLHNKQAELHSNHRRRHCRQPGREETGVISDITEEMIENACKALDDSSILDGEFAWVPSGSRRELIELILRAGMTTRNPSNI